DHPMDRVQPGATDPDDTDGGDVRGALRRWDAMEPRRGLEQSLEVTGRRTRGSCLRGKLGNTPRRRLLCRFGRDRRRRRRSLDEVVDVLDRLLERRPLAPIALARGSAFL